MTSIVSFDKTTEVTEELALCLGFFDGLHIGHIQVINKAKEYSSNVGVLTFESQIKFDKDTNNLRPMLTSLEDRAKLLSNRDVKYLIPLDFNSIKELSPYEFLKLLTSTFEVKYLVCGQDFRFGRNALGDTSTLMKYEEEFQYKAIITNLISKGEEKISASTISKLIQDGNIEEASKELGRYYSISGRVIHGLANGRRLGFKTANLTLSFPYVVPHRGVYATRAIYKGKEYLAMTNIGNHPTLDTLNSYAIETHIIDVELDIYDENLTVEFMEFIRPEKKFDGVNELIAELTRNREYIKEKYGCKKDS